MSWLISIVLGFFRGRLGMLVLGAVAMWFANDYFDKREELQQRDVLQSQVDSLAQSLAQTRAETRRLEAKLKAALDKALDEPDAKDTAPSSIREYADSVSKP